MNMKSIRIISLTALIICILNPLHAQNDAAQRLYQEGIFQMEAMGDFSAAIELFEKLVSEHPENKPLASRALLMAGRCHEKLGRQEAGKAYKRILEEYSDQREVVSEARVRLMALSERVRPAEYTDMFIRKVWQAPGLCERVSPSPDERFIVFTDSSTGDLALMELATGQTRLLTNKGIYSESSEYAFFPFFSSDGRYIAYTCIPYEWDDENRFCGLRVFDLETGALKMLMAGNYFYLRALEWSPDGKSIALIKRSKEKTFLGLYYFEGDSLSIIRSFDEYFNPVKIAFSPDGKFIAYDHCYGKEKNWLGIYSVNLETREHYVLLTHPSENFVCGWTADGSQIVFISNRTGINSIWTIPVSEGKAAGPPQMIKTDISLAVTPIRLTESGSFYYGIDSGGRDVFTATFNPDDPEPFGQPSGISRRYQGSNRAAAWSGDGRFIAFTASREQRKIYFSNAIVILDTETGRERDFILDAGPVADNISWSPDDEFVAFRSSYLKNHQYHTAIFILNAATGEINDTIKGCNASFFTDPVWSKDGKKMYFFKGYIRQMRNILVERNMETGREKILYEPTDHENGQGTKRYSYYMMYFSDDSLLLYSRRSVIEKKSDLFITDLKSNTHEPRILLTTKAPQVIRRSSSFNGDQVFFIKSRIDQMELPDDELWTINIHTEDIRKISAIPEGFKNLSIHPGGNKVLFNMGPRSNACEIWVIENLLPGRLNE